MWRRGCAHRRLVSAKQFRALLLRDQGCCTYPGCGNTLGLEAHHVRHWFWGGKTVMANLVLLCPRHHHAQHDGEFSIAPVRGRRFQFLRSDGTTLPAYVDPAPLAATGRPFEDEHADAVAALAQNLNSTSRRTA